ncbi:hypothetical protein DB346_14165 [Verrucomicrobia bacterium LW23]|nr:hypothetical protein DB346_14165 [Verrucomicrobia bacterium LW23]
MTPVPRPSILAIVLALFLSVAVSPKHSPAAEEKPSQAYVIEQLANDEQKKMAQSALNKMEAGELAEAEKILDGMIAKYPDVSLGYHYRSIMRSYQDNLEGALSDINRTLYLGPKIIAKYRSRGLIYLQLQRYAEAAADFRVVLDTLAGGEDTTVDENARETEDLLAIALFGDGGQDDEVIRLLQKARKSRNDAGWSYQYAFQIWTVYARQGKAHVYVPELKQAVESEMVRVAANKVEKPAQEWHIMMGRYLLGQVSEADLMSKASAADSESEKKSRLQLYYFYMGMKALDAGDKATAQKHLQASLDNKQGRRNEVFFAQGQLARLKKTPLPAEAR